ncbi:hypothetical protein EFQ99_03535 [Rhizobium vallis]|uniref:Uncharacterized protein n=1 Tax=Rhizobium vallis TaxID=634290 RepID=A0A3S0SUA9_9HYPH|nr:hypothetical protein [Rhizobium vallis]RUM27275.1 hypothetical protein EFQ99_03535 [Rhizobium vallis]
MYDKFDVNMLPATGRKTPVTPGSEIKIWENGANMLKMIVRAIAQAGVLGTIGTSDAQNEKSLPREEVRQAFEKRTTAGRRSAVILAGDPGRRVERLHSRRDAGGGASLRCK